MSHPEFSTLIPHQPPMCLVDTLIEYSADHLWAGVTPDAQSLFATPKGVSACVGLEYLAQAAAAFFTLHASADVPPRQGMLIACRRFTTNLAYYPLAQTLLLHVCLGSRLPPDTTTPGLVKFRGEVYLTPHHTADTAPLFNLADITPEQAATVADLSVYL
jgi:predicted hotdog family 3-hydroxylacyl-ACP dehydratase